VTTTADERNFLERLPDWVLAGPEPTRARYPGHEGWVVDEQGVHVFYEVYGDSSDTVCMLPPWALMTSRFWRFQIPYLARHFRVIAIDPRGNGRSDRPPQRESYSRAAHVRDVIAVLDAVGVESAMMISASPRAALLLALCVEHPDRVRAAVFITPQLWIEEGFARPFASTPRERYEEMEKMNPHYWREDYRGFVEWFARWIACYPHSTRLTEETVRHGLETDAETLIRATRGFEMYDRDEALRLAREEVRCPVLVTQNGGEAKYPKHTSGPLAEATAGRLHVFESLGPNVAARWPVAMNIVLREFLEAVRSSAFTGDSRDLRGPRTVA
jgi:pimeloyl-ACP methyl ester carboxylesterase